MIRRSANLVAVGPVLLVALAAASSGSSIGVGERTPALLFVVTPKGARPNTAPTELTRVADEALRDRTGFDFRAPEQAGVDAHRLAACDGRGLLACWVDSARAGGSPLAAILAITVLPIEGGDRIALTLIDTERARSCADDEPRDASAREALEDCIWAGSARTEPVTITANELPEFFRDRIADELAPLLESMGELDPFGRVAIESSTPDVELWIDGALRGTLALGPTSVEELRAGRRVFAFERPGYASERRPIHVERARTATASVNLLPLDTPRHVLGPRTMLYAGVAASAVGAALGVYAIARAGAVDGACLGSDASATCPSLGAPTFSLNADAAPSADRDRINPPGVSIPMVAVGVGAAGAGWIASSLIFEDRPWLGWLTGLGAGALGATLTAVLDPR